MSEWICPFCRKVPSSPTDKTHCYVCNGCHKLVTRDMLSELPRDFFAGSKESPTVILRGSGWTPKFGGKE